ncbi:heat shock protein Hsp90 [Gonapodya prolifera JEL478]|uniref:Heat shock protein Hsp90 n=1 Tax=Gonapodya prolifera (strain JEL478) TaxID=1344416 RepID=A0A139AUT4_GONPJ|nr:heat shock protein Hsp90 [Gonapodya prolifera JEL478]|eukprot:KXS20478.1 heat shock protein Hsp90 [Gonapodya prolifera JEL478]
MSSRLASLSAARVAPISHRLAHASTKAARAAVIRPSSAGARKNLSERGPWMSISEHLQAFAPSVTRRHYTTTIDAEEDAAAPPKEPEEKLILETEKVTGPSSQHSFKAETKRLLDIVAKSLYTDREVFVRELTSNASDALEKRRHLELSSEVEIDPDTQNEPLEIRISVDKVLNTFIIQDTGIGMTFEELNENLGTIARSGTREFLGKLDKAAAEGSKGVRDNIIGQFGVGFYSSLMVADEVKVYTRSALKGSTGYCWSTDGSGSYDVAEAEGVAVGTKIIIKLKDDSKEFSSKYTVESILKKYSNFVGHPITLNGTTVNTIGALWTLDKSSITEEQHRDFYRFISHAYDEPRFHLHYKTDSPLAINALLYVPERHSELFGMGRMEPGVNLYSRKVLIQAKAKKLLPDWLRFMRGVVDSEDVPLNISREHLQDSALISRLRNVLSSRIVKFLDEQSRKDPEAYNTFYKDFALFIKEGVATDSANRSDAAKLLRYETSSTDAGAVSPLQAVLDRNPDQPAIFYTVSPSRTLALESPYVEPFVRKGYEVLLCAESVDEFVMNNLAEYGGKKIVNVESREGQEMVRDSEEDAKEGTGALTKEEARELADWMDNVLGDRVSEVDPSPRALSVPALIVDHDSAVLRRIMQMAPSSPARDLPLPPQKLHIDPRNPIIAGLNRLRAENELRATIVAEQVCDNAFVAAGLLDDPRSMLKRLNTILEMVVRPTAPAESVSESESVEAEIVDVKN